MNIAVVILCRYSSSRLPGKILKTIQGKSILEHIIDRIKVVFPMNQIIVATSNDPTDQPIVDWCEYYGVQFFRGDLDNVSERFLKAAQNLKATYAIRINGDNLFVDTSLLLNFKKIIISGKYDFISNVKDRTYPKGMSIEAVKVEYYQSQFKHFTDKSDFEHVTSFLYEHPPENAYYFYNKSLPEAAGIQLAIDTQQDFDIAAAIMNQLEGNPKDSSLEEIYKLYKTLK